MKNYIKYRLFAVAALWLLFSLPVAYAQAHYPDHPIKLVVPFSAGGGLDYTAREIGRRLEQALGQPIVIENKPGAGGELGVRTVTNAAADGYTLLMSTAGETAIAPALNPAIGYNPIKDLAPIALVVRAPNVLAVNSKIPVHSLTELIAYAKANPGKLTYATAGVGTAQHLQGEYLNKLAHIDTLHVPYKGSSQAVIDVAGNRVSMTYASPGVVRPYVQKGTLRALAVTTDSRLPSMPDVPAVKEILPEFELQSWFALFAPAGTPGPIVSRINSEVVKMLRDPALAASLGEKVGIPSFETPAEFSAILVQDVKRARDIVRDAKITVE